MSVLRVNAGNAWKLFDVMVAARANTRVVEDTMVCALANACILEDANESARRLFDIDSATLAGTPIATVLTEDARRLFADGMLRLYHGKTALAYEGNLAPNGGQTFPVTFGLWYGDDANGLPDHIYFSATKTSRPTYERAADGSQLDLARAARIGLLGEMTASIAHEVNQPLSSIIASADAGLRWLDRPEFDVVEIKRLLERIAKNGKRAADVISTMRAMATNGKTEHLPAMINTIIEEAILLLQTDFAKRQIDVRLDLAPNLPFVAVDKVQILQVIVNLALNAAQAMSDSQAWSRTLSIRTRSANDNSVIVEVEDSGPGIDPNARERLFESFYTTKETGTGMGLAICRSILEAHDSRIDLYSSPHLGARFSFLLRTYDVETAEPQSNLPVRIPPL